MPGYRKPLDLLSPEDQEAVRVVHDRTEPYHALHCVAGDAQKIFGYLRTVRETKKVLPVAAQ